MNLYFVRRKDHNSPSIWDQAQAYVIIAECPYDARQIAQKQHEFNPATDWDYLEDLWTNSEKSTVRLLSDRVFHPNYIRME